MAGTLEINDTAAWMPAGWVYDGVLDLLADKLRDVDPELSSILRRALTAKTGYGDLTSLSEERFVELLRAAEAVYLETVQEGAAAFYDPSFYPAFIRQLATLIEMIRSDNRSGKAAQSNPLQPATPSSAH